MSLTLYLCKISFVKPYLKKTMGFQLCHCMLKEFPVTPTYVSQVMQKSMSLTSYYHKYQELKQPDFSWNYYLLVFARHYGKEQRQLMTSSLPSRSLEYSWEKKINVHETNTRQLKKYVVGTGVSYCKYPQCAVATEGRCVGECFSFR